MAIKCRGAKFRWCQNHFVSGMDLIGSGVGKIMGKYTINYQWRFIAREIYQWWISQWYLDTANRNPWQRNTLIVHHRPKNIVVVSQRHHCGASNKNLLVLSRE